MKAKPILLIALISGAVLHAQPAPPVPVDPFKADVGKAPVEPRAPHDILVRYEVFSIDPAKAAVMRREKPTEGQFYEALVGLIAKGEVIQEDFAILRCRSGNLAKMASIREYIYPTEFVPAMITTASAQTKEELPLKAASPQVVVPTTATAFETRDTGLTIEMEATMGEDRDSVDLRISPQHVSLVERWKWGQGTSETEMPNFESQRLTTMVGIPMGSTAMLGTMSPSPGSKIMTNRIWFAFATVRLNKK
jgi:hypothetical protein